MTPKKLSLIELLDLIELEDYRGIISKEGFVREVQKGIMPKMINDIRGALRLTVERNGEGFDVIQHETELAQETVGQIY